MKTQQTLERSRFLILTVFACVIVLQGNVFAQTNTFPSDGNVGIGTTTPNHKLELLSSDQYKPSINIASSSHATSERASISFGVNSASTLGWSFGQDRNATGTRDFYLYDIANSRDVMYWSTAGNVGIGTTNPHLQSGMTNKMLEIQGSVNPGLALTATSAGGRQFFLYSSQINPGYFAVFDAAAVTNRFVINSNGDVGIGNSDPQSTLQVGTQTGSATANPVKISLGGTYSNAPGTNLKLRLYDDGVAAHIYGIGVSAGSMDFGVSSTAAYNWYSGGGHKMILNTEGNLGVGTTSPTAKLHVAGDGKVTGNLTVDGNIAAKYQDLAEWVPAAHVLPPGTVVTLKPKHSNLVEASSKAYDTRVAGVISLQPGIALGERGENKVLVATTGRVRIKVDATKAPIEVGDLLVTSEKEGVAMKSEPINFGGVEIHRPGTIIGKALEPLAHGTGEILVLLSLQ